MQCAIGMINQKTTAVRLLPGRVLNGAAMAAGAL